MKKVLLIATVQSHIAQFHKPLMKLLKESGHEIHVAARNNLIEKNGLTLDYPDRVFDIPFQRSPFDKKNITAFIQLKSLLKKEQYDIIHCNTPVGGFIGRLAGKEYRKLGTRIYYTAHGFHFYKGAPLKNWIFYYPIERWLSYYTDKLITITEEDCHLANRRFHSKVYRIHGVGVDESRYFPVNEEQKQLLKGKFGINGQVILNVGELLPNKNHVMAIKVMSRVVAEFPQATLIIAGNGPEEVKLKEMIALEGLENNIKMIGYCTHLQDYQQIADILISCSYREGLPLNIVESMLSGTLVIASNNRGHRELIEDGRTGFLVNVDDVDTMADRIKCVLRNPSIYMRIIQNALNKGKLYGTATVLDELRIIYEIEKSL